MPKLSHRLPKYRLHRPSGQAVVTLDMKDHYLGPHGTDVSKALYDRLVAEWLANGRRSPATGDTRTYGITTKELILRFWNHAQNYYCRPDGSPTTEVDNYRRVLRILRRAYGAAPAAEFGPLSLKAVREQMILAGWSRRSINHQIGRVKAVFRWAVENELVPPDVYHGLQAVKGLQRGRTNAKECLPVKPVPEELINGIKPFVSRQVWALIQLQLFTGARPGELVGLRGIDLKTGSETWSVEPEGHKTAHHGHTRRILFGPQAQAVLQVFLQDRPLDAHLFSPIEAEAERREQQHAARRTPLSCGNRPGTNRRQSPRRRPSQCYDVTSYRHAIWRACDDAFPPPDHLVRLKVKGKRGHRRETRAEWQARLGPDAWREQLAWQRAHRWHPHQLRHNAGTHIRKEFGIELARIILGQRSLSVTEIYAEVDEQKAKDVIRQIG